MAGLNPYKKEVTMKKYRIIITFSVFSLFIILGASTQAGTLEGTIQGFTCLTHGKVCPADRMDPHLSLEKNFVLADFEKGYHLMPNLDRSVLARNINKKARVTGHINPKYKSVEVEKLEVHKEGKWHEVWSLEAYEMEKKEWEEIQMR